MSETWIANPIPWPDGKRCAAAVTFDVDVDSMLRLNFGAQAPNRMAALSWLRNDLLAVERIVRMYKERGLRQTFFFPGYCIDRYPKLIKTVRADRHEVGLHGYLHEISMEQDAATEREILERTVAAAARVMDTQPTGWRAPLYGLSARSPELLLEHGFDYDASLMGDDQPYLLRTPHGDLVELPSDWANDDWVQYAHSPEFECLMQVRAPARAAEVYTAEFEAAYRHGGLWIGVFHPNITGRLSRLEQVAKLLDSMLSRGDVWIATLGEISSHVREVIAEGRWQPRIADVEPADESSPSKEES